MATDQKDPIERLEKLYESGNKRIDQYLDQLRTFYQQEGELSPAGERIFDHMQKEIAQTRMIRNVAIALVLVLGGLAGFLFFKKESQGLKQDNYTFILEKIKASNLPLRLEGNGNGGLSVVLDRGGELTRKEREALEKIEDAVPALGQINYLGSSKRLRALLELDSDDNIFFRINAQETPIGKLQLRWEQGAIGLIRSGTPNPDENPQYELGVAYDYIDNFKSMDFVVRITGYDKRTQSWKFQFGERQAGEIIWDTQNNYQIQRSANGRIERRPIIAASPEWRNMYVVAIGIGEWGVDENDITQIKYAWNMNSFAQKIRLD